MNTTLREAAQQALEALEKTIVLHDPMRVSAITALSTALAQQEECRWLQDGDEESSTWQASCSRRYFMLEDGSPKDNRMTHCCYCGKTLVEVPIEPEPGEDDHDGNCSF